MKAVDLFGRGGLATVLGAVVGCGARPQPPPLTVTPPGPIAVDVSQAQQTIDGFGASSAWTAGNMTDARADELFSPTAGIGLSLLRVRIAPDGTTAELATAQLAVARGARVWATPWSPPANWKDSTSMANGGGSILSTEEQPWAARLASFAQSMSAAGVPLLYLSSQNEPDYVPTTYESCGWTAGALADFVGNDLGPALAAVGVPVMAPETANWGSFDGFASTFAADSSAMQYLGPFATHAYAGTPHTVAAVAATGRHVWETEVSDPNKTVDTGMGSGLWVATNIHQSLVNGQVSAWHYWWINPGSADNSALTSKDAASGTNLLTRRAYVMGNWARFVRPGFVRVSATPDSQSSVYTTAFSDPASGRVVIVAVNINESDAAQDFTVAGAAVDVATPWVTSDTLALAAQTPVSVVAGAFSYTLPARSVTTFVADPAVPTN